MNKSSAAIAGAALLAVSVTVGAIADKDTLSTPADLKAAGISVSSVYAERDPKTKAISYVDHVTIDDGICGRSLGVGACAEVRLKLESSPCARRPTGTEPALCLTLETDGGTRDQGDENTILPDQSVGAGCVQTACAIMAGDQAEAGPGVPQP